MYARSMVGMCAVTVLVLSQLSGVAAAAPAASGDHRSAGGWTIQTAAAPAQSPNGHLSSVHCLSAASCVAVGYSHDRVGVDIALVQEWNGSDWTIVPSPNPENASDTFLTGLSCPAAASWVQSCTAVGDYLDAGGNQLPLAEQWNGRLWRLQHLPSPAGATQTFLTGVSCASPTSCVAVGYSRRGSEPTTTVTERWDGTTWRLQASPNLDHTGGNRLTSVSCTSGSACTAVGFAGDMFADPLPVAERWNGSAWTVQPAPLPAGATRGVLSSVSCAATAECIAVGYWHDDRKGGGPLSELWDGTAWVAQPTPAAYPTDTYTAVSCSMPGSCVAIGKSRPGYVAARWDGAQWSPISAPAGDTGLDGSYVGLSCPGLNTCVTVGAAQTADYGYSYLTQAASWNGAAWTAQAPADPLGVTQNYLSAISCATDRSCVVVGASWDRRDSAGPLVEHWNGTSWRIDPTPAQDDASLSAVSCVADDDCLAVGGFVDRSGQAAALAEAWDGHTWRVEPVPIPAGATAAGFTSVSCSAGPPERDHPQPRSACVAVGAFADADGHESALVERRTGSAWSVQPVPVPTGTATSVLDAISCSTVHACTAVGGYETASASPFQPSGPCSFWCPVSEHWDGANWTASLPANPETSTATNLSAVSCAAPNRCTAVGQWVPQDREGGHPGITLAEGWNGSSWTVQPTPDPPDVGGTGGTNNSPFQAVSCPPTSGCTSVGNYASTDPDGDFLPFAEHRDQQQWRLQMMPAPTGSFYNDMKGVSCPAPDMCMAVGSTQRYNTADLSSGPQTSLIERYRRHG